MLLGPQQQPGSEKDEVTSGEVLATLVQGLCELSDAHILTDTQRQRFLLFPRKSNPWVT